MTRLISPIWVASRPGSLRAQEYSSELPCSDKSRVIRAEGRPGGDKGSVPTRLSVIPRDNSGTQLGIAGHRWLTSMF